MDSVKVLSVMKKRNKVHMSSWQHLGRVKWVPSMQVESRLSLLGFSPPWAKSNRLSPGPLSGYLPPLRHFCLPCCIHLSTHSFIHSTHSFTYLFSHSFAHSFIHSVIHLFHQWSDAEYPLCLGRDLNAANATMAKQLSGSCHCVEETDIRGVTTNGEIRAEIAWRPVLDQGPGEASLRSCIWAESRMRRRSQPCRCWR